LLKRAQILLAADGGAIDEEIARSVGVGMSTVYRTRQRFVEVNLEGALSEEPRMGAARKLSGKEEALLVATACSKAPAGCARWTLKLLAGQMLELTGLLVHMASMKHADGGSPLCILDASVMSISNQSRITLRSSSALWNR